MTQTLSSNKQTTEEVVAQVPALVKMLKATFRSGKTRPLSWRLEQLRGLQAMIRENSDEWAEVLHADLGKSSLEAALTETQFLLAELDLTVKNLEKWAKPRKVTTPMTLQPSKSYIHQDPLGTVLIIAPWNYPLQLSVGPVIGAIAAGNTVVLKPSELAPATSAAMARLIPQYVDPEAVVVVEGAVEETTALLEHQWDHILYTGNGVVARVIAAAAAKHLTPTTLELGGKSPCIVTSDANLALTARRIMFGRMMNAGQTCVAPDYVLVERDVHDALVDQLAKVVRDFYGDNPQDSADIARIVNERHFDRLVGLLPESDPKNGKVAVGGTHDRAARFVAPTVLVDVDPTAPVMQEEIFGPILPVIAVDSIDAAIDFVNDRDKPLALYVFSQTSELEDKVLEQTSSGGACVNATVFQVSNPFLPFGGVGQSGQGAYHGEASFTTFSHAKSVLRRSQMLDPGVMYPPFTPTKQTIIKKLI
ncbi:MAG: aldehyde dehydrogenase family protein [Acidimicrobiia bacterium]|nr:aldehyde dehydrogenase family protein [Acidimicrobiia bacterium]MBP8180717.1 aldehyde dehydrogenase family protein [Acidimicrobiia bacterium]